MKNCRNTIRTLNIGVFSLACVYRHLVIQKSKGLQHAEKTSYGNSSGTRRRKARARDRNSWQARETSCLPRVGSVLRIDTASRRFVFRGDCLEPCGSWLFGCLLAGPVRRGVDVLVWRDRVDSFSAVGKLCFAGLDVCPFWWVHKGPRRAPERVAKQKKRDEISTRATSIECASSYRMYASSEEIASNTGIGISRRNIEKSPRQRRVRCSRWSAQPFSSVVWQADWAIE